MSEPVLNHCCSFCACFVSSSTVFHSMYASAHGTSHEAIISAGVPLLPFPALTLVPPPSCLSHPDGGPLFSPVLPVCRCCRERQEDNRERIRNGFPADPSSPHDAAHSPAAAQLAAEQSPSYAQIGTPAGETSWCPQGTKYDCQNTEVIFNAVSL